LPKRVPLDNHTGFGDKSPGAMPTSPDQKRFYFKLTIIFGLLLNANLAWRGWQALQKNRELAATIPLEPPATLPVAVVPPTIPDEESPVAVAAFSAVVRQEMLQKQEEHIRLMQEAGARASLLLSLSIGLTVLWLMAAGKIWRTL
jgi:hypothetical protein